MERIEEQGRPASVARARRRVAQDRASLGERALTLLDRLIFFSLLIIIFLTTIPYGTVEPWWEAAFQCAIFALVAVWIIEGMARGGVWNIKGYKLLIPLLAIAAYAFIQTIPLSFVASSGWKTISADPYGTRLVALKLLALAMAGALLLRFTSSRRRLRALIYAVLITAVASAIFGIIRETTHHNAAGFLLPQLKPQVGYGQFINRNHFAFLMEMGFGLALGLIVGRGENRERLFFIAAALPVWMALVLANSRGGILSLLSQMLFVLVMYGAQGKAHGFGDGQYGRFAWLREATAKLPVRIVLILCLLGAMVGGVLWIGGDPLAKRLETIQNEVASEDADAGEGARRIQIWQATWKMFKAHPVTGIGFGSYWVAITEFYDVPGKKRPYEAHNDYLELLVSGGIIGLGLGVWLLASLRMRVRETLNARDAFRRAACLGALTGLFGVAVHSIVDFGLQITANALVCVALVVIATVDERIADEAASPQTSQTPRHRPKAADAA